MNRKVANVDLFGQAIQTGQGVIEQIYTIADIIQQRAARKKEKIKLKEAKDILDKAYAIKDEGQTQLNKLKKELKKINESFYYNTSGLINLYEAFFKKVLESIRNFFKKALTKTSALIKRAKRI